MSTSKISKTILFHFGPIALFTATIVLLGLTFLTSDSDYSYSTTSRRLSDLKGCISRKNKLVYVHIPKTGGSTIERSKLFEDKKITGGHFKIWQMMFNSEKDGISDFVTATTVRHPCDRFISAFRYLTSNKCNEGDRVLSKQLIADRNIDEYVEHLEKIQWTRVQQHFEPQYKFVLNIDELSVGVDNVLCQEQWNEGIDRLKNAIGTTDKLEGLKKNHVLQNEHETCQDLKPATRHAIEKHYFMDYCLFDYDFGPSTPQTGEKQCIGKNNDKESLSMRLHDCLEIYDQIKSDETFDQNQEGNILY